MDFRSVEMVLWRLDKRKETRASDQELEKPKSWGATYVAGCDLPGREVRFASAFFAASFDIDDGFNPLLCDG